MSLATPEDLCDWDKTCAVIAGSEPWWEPGTKTAYHAGAAARDILPGVQRGGPDQGKSVHVGFGLRHQPHRYRPAGDHDRVRDGRTGGSCAQADTATGVAFASTKNRLTADFGAAEQVAGIVTKAFAERQAEVRAGFEIS